jgi:hypothetical protein
MLLFHVRASRNSGVHTAADDTYKATAVDVQSVSQVPYLPLLQAGQARQQRQKVCV